jgi:hypothetical protein
MIGNPGPSQGSRGGLTHVLRPPLLRPVVVFALALSLLFSGCVLGPADPNPPQDGGDAHLVRDPSDYSYLDDPTNASRPHIHDYWGDRTEIEVLDKVFHLTFNRFEGASDTLGRYSTFVYLPEGSTVFPGTALVNITVEWSSPDAVQKSLTVHWWAANPEYNGMADFPTGSSTTISVPSNDTTNDLPHTTASAWRLRLSMSGSAGSMDVRVGVLIHRQAGELALAPAHPDLWGNNTSLTLHDGSGALSRPEASPSQKPPQYPRVENLTPAHATQVHVYLAYNSTTARDLHWKPVLSWHGADRHKGHWERERTSPSEHRSGPGGELLLWIIPVEPRMWDSPYASESQWTFEFDYESSRLPTSYMKGDYHLWIEARRGQ